MKLESVSTPNLFFYKTVWLFRVSWIFIWILGSSLSISAKVLMRNTVTVQIILGSNAIFLILSLPNDKHGIFSHLLISSLISFNNVLQFRVYKSFIFLLNLFLFYSLWCYCKFVLTSCSGCSLLVYRNITNFYRKLYSATLLLLGGVLYR